ncbi:hypothetical protein D3C86_1465760 [compost metagenome]
MLVDGENFSGSTEDCSDVIFFGTEQLDINSKARKIETTVPNFFLFTFLAFLEQRTYNAGIINTPIMVPINIPPTEAVPIVRFPIALAPEENIKGIKPATKANDVIKIGLKRAMAPSIAASTIVMPCLFFSTAYSTIRMAFFPNRPINMTSATCA